MIAAVANVESEMFLHAGQEKKLSSGQILIAKVTLKRAPCLKITNQNGHLLYMERVLVRHKTKSSKRRVLFLPP